MGRLKFFSITIAILIAAFLAIMMPRISHAAGPKEYKNHCGERFTYGAFVQGVINGNGEFIDCPSLEIEVSFLGSDIKALRWKGTGNRRQLWVEIEYNIIAIEGKTKAKQSFSNPDIRWVEIDVQAFPDEWGGWLLIREFGELRDYVVYWGTVEFYVQKDSRGRVEYVEVDIIPAGCDGCFNS